MLHLTLDNDKLYNEKNTQSVKECIADYEKDNNSVYDILDQICKDTNLYPHVKQYKSKRDCRRAFCVGHFTCLGLNHMNGTASETE